MDYLLSLIIFFPCFGALILGIFLRGENLEANNNAKLLTLVSTIAPLIFSIFVFSNFNPNNNKHQKSKYSEYKLELTNVKSIRSIDWDNGNIFIILDDNLSMKLLSIDGNNKLKVIQIINSKDIKYTKLK